MKLSDYPQLKREILGLPEKERDRLLLRLIAKDKILTERMHFLLIEGEDSIGTRVDDLKVHLDEIMEMASGYERSDAGALIKLIRLGMKDINHFYKVTKSKYEMLSLKLYFLNVVNLGQLKSTFLRSQMKSELLYKYLIKTTLTIHKSVATLHPDLQFDLAALGEQWLAHLHAYAPKGLARDLGLIKNWS
ncbi:MAG: hypothetical protein EOO99_03680 [Pedobacter sp.]|nr:MAG: hypothetical protein EOO99_03680 [Pedobacter sp.]